MQPINLLHHAPGGRLPLRPSSPLPYLVLAGLLIVCLPLGIWGKTSLQGHVNSLAIIVLFGVSMAIENFWIRLFGVIVTLWLSVVTFFAFFSVLDEFTRYAVLDNCMKLGLMGMVWVFILYAPIEDELIYNLVRISALVQALIALLQYVGLDPVKAILSPFISLIRDLPEDFITGTLGNNNFLAAYLAISLPYFFEGKWRLGIFPVALALLLAKTYTAVIAAIVGVFCYLWGFFGIGFAAALAGLVITFSNHIMHNERWDYWLDAFRQVSDSWVSILIGYGPAAVWQVGNQLHNEFVSTFYYYGLIGVICMCGFIATLYRGNRMLYAAFIVAVVDMLGNHPLHVATTAVLIVTTCALIGREARNERRQ